MPTSSEGYAAGGARVSFRSRGHRGRWPCHRKGHPASPRGVVNGDLWAYLLTREGIDWFMSGTLDANPECESVEDLIGAAWRSPVFRDVARHDPGDRLPGDWWFNAARRALTDKVKP